MAAKVITIDKNILKKNEVAAQENRSFFLKKKVLAVNLLSSPGAGKTTLLVKTTQHLKTKLKISVTVGDLQTTEDAEKIEGTGIPVVQINTGTACHLDANMVQKSLRRIPLQNTDILFIENVGNLVCPASFDLGEHLKVVILSTAEGEEKPLKYPPIFLKAHCVCINKMDLLPYIDFSLSRCRKNLNRICPNAEIFELSCKTGSGFEHWINWLEQKWQSEYGEA